MLKLQEISKYYEHCGVRESIIDNISFSVELGEIVALTGSSGSGKSTVLQIAGLLDKASFGKVFFGGRDCSSLSDYERTRLRCSDIGFIYQSYNLLSDFSVLHNIIMPCMILKRHCVYERAKEVAYRLGILHLLYKKINCLSGGERQRVAIARALVNSPRLILADEPTGSLDHKNSMKVFSLFINSVKEQGSAVIIVTHDKSLASQADRVFDLEDGSLND